MCSLCAGVLDSSREGDTRRSRVFLLSRTSFYLFDSLSVTCLPNDRFGCRPHCKSFVAFCYGRSGCAPANAPYVVYTDERGQVTSAACRVTARPLDAPQHLYPAPSPHACNTYNQTRCEHIACHFLTLNIHAQEVSTYLRLIIPMLSDPNLVHGHVPTL